MRLSPPASVLLLTAVLVKPISAHVRHFASIIDGIDQGRGCGFNGKPFTPHIRCCPANDEPIKDLNSIATRCGHDTSGPKAKWLPVKGKSIVTFEWRHDKREDEDPKDMIIDSSHKGPLQVYIAPGGKDGEGKVWQKLWQDKGTAPSEWGTLKLRAAGGRHWIKMPDIAPGKYLLRSEILALHASDARYDQNKDRGLQMYTSCMQVEIPADAVAKGKPTLSTEGAVAFPGAYKYDDTKGVHYSIYTNIATALANYEPPGGPIWKGPGSNGEGGFGTGPGAKNLRAR